MNGCSLDSSIHDNNIRQQTMQNSTWLSVKGYKIPVCAWNQGQVGLPGQLGIALYRTWRMNQVFRNTWDLHTAPRTHRNEVGYCKLANTYSKNKSPSIKMRTRKEAPVILSQAWFSFILSMIQKNILLSPNSLCLITAEVSGHRDQVFRIFPSSIWCIVEAEIMSLSCLFLARLPISDGQCPPALQEQGAEPCKVKSWR